ncbi:putative AAA_15 domain-containing protein [Vibrio chagasii]|nr:putative AAA_15 domain-containing protein [Vibrio chagasii]CAH6936346.1 putative AAA_15 domain-containing protein [Vibrio chagasii]CAH6962353.1 putative AAA_15 domain-containing protein [Vibrio chagasii]CAH7020255.1 putative AAA_15 domain-containing protein [Vibrio chagasii]CAH7145994.1 putative AAA_15 domain-containing protein [Vibrio chagasii]
MKLACIYISYFKDLSDLLVPLNGSFDCQFNEDKILTLSKREDTSKYYRDIFCSAIIGANGVGKTTILDFLESFVALKEPLGFVVFYDENEKKFKVSDPYKIIEKCQSESVDTEVTAKKLVKDHNVSLLKINNLSGLDNLLKVKEKTRSPHIHNHSISRFNTGNKKSEHFDKIISFSKESNMINSNAGYTMTANFPPIFGILKKPTEEIQVIEHGSEVSFEPMTNKVDFPRNAYDMKIIEQWKANTTLSSPNVLKNCNFLFNYLLIPITHYVIKNTNLKISSHISYFCIVIEEYLRETSQELNYDKIVFHKVLFNSFQKIDRRISLPEPIDLKKVDVSISEICNELAKLVEKTNYIKINDSNKKNSISISNYSSFKELNSAVKKIPEQVSSFIKIGLDGISSGELAKTNIFAELHDYIKNSNNKNENSENNENNENNETNTILVIDEADLYLHPEWQRKFLYELIEVINKHKLSTNIQIILSSHSPIIISDFLPDDITTLHLDRSVDELGEERYKTVIKRSLGFGTNIAELFIDGMHINSTFGQHSKKALESIFRKYELGNLNDFDKYLISQIGNEHIKKYLSS